MSGKEAGLGFVLERLGSDVAIKYAGLQKGKAGSEVSKPTITGGLS
jgi:hypothetical protein